MQKLFGSLLLGCGIIVAGLSGLCTLVAAGTSLIGAASGQESLSQQKLGAFFFAGNAAKFPNATIIVQRDEIINAFWPPP